MMNGMSNMAAMNAKMAAGFGSYGRYPSLTGYSNGAGYPSSSASAAYNGYTDAVQTDTPPQTPPNLKLNAANSLGQHQYHPYVSPQQQQQQQLNRLNPMPLPPTMTAGVESDMPSPGSSRSQHLPMAAPSTTPSSAVSITASAAAMMTAPVAQHGSPTSSDSTSSTAFRPVYRT